MNVNEVANSTSLPSSAGCRFAAQIDQPLGFGHPFFGKHFQAEGCRRILAFAPDLGTPCTLLGANDRGQGRALLSIRANSVHWEIKLGTKPCNSVQFGARCSLIDLVEE